MQLDEGKRKKRDAYFIGHPKFIEYLYEESPISFCIVNSDGKILDHNKSFLRLVAGSDKMKPTTTTITTTTVMENNLSGKSIFLYDAGINQETIRNIFDQCQKNGKAIVMQLAWLKSNNNKDGDKSILPISVSCNRLDYYHHMFPTTTDDDNNIININTKKSGSNNNNDRLFVFTMTDLSEPYKIKKEAELANEEMKNRE